MAIGQELDRLVEIGLDGVVVDPAGVEDALGLGLFAGDALLFFPENVEGGCVGVVRLQQLLTLGLQCS